MNRVSVVISTVDRPESLAQTLTVLGHLVATSFDLEVVVVCGPDDVTVDSLDRWADHILVQTCPDRNLSMSRNIGIAAATGAFIAFIDDDAYPDPFWIEDLLAGFVDENVGAVGGPVLDHTGVNFQARASLANRYGRSTVLDDLGKSAWLNSPWSPDYVYPIGTNGLYRKAALVSVGGFDEVFEYHLDDVDIARRVIDAGWRVRALEHGTVYHKYRPSHLRTVERAFPRRYLFLKNSYYFALRHAPDRSRIPAEFSDYEASHRADLRKNIQDGLIPSSSMDQFERDRIDAVAAATQAADDLPRIRAATWFSSPHERRLFPTRTSRPESIVVVNPDPAERERLAASPQIVWIVQTDDVERVDFEDGVWVRGVANGELDSVARRLEAEWIANGHARRDE